MNNSIVSFSLCSLLEHNFFVQREKYIRRTRVSITVTVKVARTTYTPRGSDSRRFLRVGINKENVTTSHGSELLRTRRKGAATRCIHIGIDAPRCEAEFVGAEFAFVPVSSDRVTRDLQLESGFRE